MNVQQAIDRLTVLENETTEQLEARLEANNKAAAKRAAAEKKKQEAAEEE